METTIKQSPIELIKSFGWEPAGYNTINGKEVRFFLNKDQPRKLLKWYPEKNGFMVSEKGVKIRSHGLQYNGMDGKTPILQPFKDASQLEKALKSMNNDRW